MADGWTWTVEGGFRVPGRGVVVHGSRSGELPTIGEYCTVEHNGGGIPAQVSGLELIEPMGRARRDDLLGHEAGLLLGGVDMHDVPVGAVVRGEAVESLS